EGGGLLRSSDQGQSWTSIPVEKLAEVHPIELPDGRIATLTEQYVIVSADKGQTWTPVTSATPFRGEGLTYSKQQQAFFVWRATTTEGVPEDSLVRYDWDFAAP
ncbi:MAG TPA: sialidase family protein, partial [Polyangiaceae bacterium]